MAEFAEEAMDGNEDKLAAKVDFLAGCAAVYVMAIGASAIKKLMAKGIQPIRVDEIDGIDELLRRPLLLLLLLLSPPLAWFLVVYPNFSALPLPTRFSITAGRV